MKIHALELPGVLLVEPDAPTDSRGFFIETWNADRYREAGFPALSFVQDNHSRSARGVLRGLHYQLPPRAQGKLVRVVQGEVFDVAVDIRRGSPTFGKWVGESLSAENHRQMWVPPGFAHGFVTVSETAEFLYKTTDVYAPDCERCIAWNDPMIGIDWRLSGEPLLSAKDRQGVSLAAAEVFG